MNWIYISILFKIECKKKASRLYDVKLEGEGIFNSKDKTYTFTLATKDLSIPDCIQGNIYNA